MINKRTYMAVSLCCVIAWAANSTAQEPSLQAPADEPSVLSEPSPAEEFPETLDLETAKAIALQENPSLQAAAARVRQAKARVTQARSTFFPQIQADASVANTWLDENSYRSAKRQAFLGQLQSSGASASALSQNAPVLSAAGSVSNSLASAIIARDRVDNDFTTYQASISAGWLLFDGFEREFSYAAAKYGAKESEAAYLEASRLLLDAVATTYYSATLAREDVRISQADEEFNLRQLEEAKARRRVGTGSLSDVLNFEVRVNSARAQRISAERQYQIALIGLAELMGFPEYTPVQGTEVEALPEEIADEAGGDDVGALVTLALAKRPDLQQTQHAASRTEAAMKARRGPFFPEVSVSASRSASETERWFGEDDLSTTVGLNVSYELFTGGRNRAHYVEAKAVRDEASRDLASLENSVVADVRQGVESLRAAREQLWLQRANAAFVRRNRELVEKEYAAGQASLVRLNEAQRDLVAAEANLALARVGLLQSQHDLKTATGEVLDSYRED